MIRVSEDGRKGMIYEKTNDALAFFICYAIIRV